MPVVELCDAYRTDGRVYIFVVGALGSPKNEHPRSPQENLGLRDHAQSSASLPPPPYGGTLPPRGSVELEREAAGSIEDLPESWTIAAALPLISSWTVAQHDRREAQASPAAPSMDSYSPEYLQWLEKVERHYPDMISWTGTAHSSLLEAGEPQTPAPKL